MLPLSSIAIEEKNKINNATSVFLIAFEITIPGVEEVIRLVANTENITWRGTVWSNFPVTMEEVNETTGEVPRVDLKVSNVNRVLEYYIQLYDSYVKTNGYSEVTCTIYIVNTLNLGSDDPEVQHDFILIQPKTDPMWATFTLGASNPWRRRYPQRRMIPACSWRFKSDECGYTGPETTCNKTTGRCIEIGNLLRFGGFYILGRLESA